MTKRQSDEGDVTYIPGVWVLSTLFVFVALPLVIGFTVLFAFFDSQKDQLSTASHAAEMRQYDVRHNAQLAGSRMFMALADDDPGTTAESAATSFAASHPEYMVFLPEEGRFNTAITTTLVRVEVREGEYSVFGTASDDYRGELLWLRVTSEGVTTLD